MIDVCDHLHRDGRVMSVCPEPPVYAFSATAPDGLLSWWGACTVEHLEALIFALDSIDLVVPSPDLVRRRHRERLADGRGWPKRVLAEAGWRPERRVGGHVPAQRVSA